MHKKENTHVLAGVLSWYKHFGLWAGLVKLDKEVPYDQSDPPKKILLMCTCVPHIHMLPAALFIVTGGSKEL